MFVPAPSQQERYPLGATSRTVPEPRHDVNYCKMGVGSWVDTAENGNMAPIVVGKTIWKFSLCSLHSPFQRTFIERLDDIVLWNEQSRKNRPCTLTPEFLLHAKCVREELSRLHIKCKQSPLSFALDGRHSPALKTCLLPSDFDRNSHVK
jgi:hypothetical protein